MTEKKKSFFTADFLLAAGSFTLSLKIAGAALFLLYGGRLRPLFSMPKEMIVLTVCGILGAWMLLFEAGRFILRKRGLQR